MTVSPASDAAIGIEWIGVGAYVPETVLTNDDMARLVDTSDEWIATRTGIRQRHVVSGDQTVADLAIAAARDALNSAGLTGADIDLILVATSTPDTIYPGVACQVQAAIDAPRAFGFDMALACSGFVFALTTAQQFLRTGMRKTALVIGADIHSRFVDWSDRNTCVLFADGAGAAIIRGEAGAPDHFLSNALYTDGAKGAELTLRVNSQNCPLVAPRQTVAPYVSMNGREMFKFAVGVAPTAITAALAAAGLRMDQIDYLVLHQANIRIMQAMSEKLGIAPEKLIANLDAVGNTSAASIPIAINDAVLKGQIRPGQMLTLCGFGAGVAWGATVMRWTLADRRLQASDAAGAQESIVCATPA